MTRLDIGLLERAKSRLGEAVLDPRRWPSLMEAICAAAFTTGATLLQADIRTPDVPVTPSVSDFVRNYFDDNLHVGDIRAAKGVPLLLSGRNVVRDQDIFSSERSMLRNPLYATASKFGLRWWSVVSFRSGPSLWGLALQRSIREGMFEEDEMRVLASLSDSLTDVATLSRAVGRRVLFGSLNAFELISQPALSISASGLVIETNRAATELFDADFRVRSNRLYMRDAKASQALERILWQRPGDGEIRPLARENTGNVIVVRREAKKPVLIRVLPVHPVASSPFLGARAILVLRDLEVSRRPPVEILSAAFSLTAAEARVASMIAAGFSPEEISDELMLSRETVRNQLKAVFGKTGTHRQNELAALIARIQGA